MFNVDWEFTAPHWCDFSQEDAEVDADAWFDAQTEKPTQLGRAKPDPAAPAAAARHRATRIPVASHRKSKPGIEAVARAESQRAQSRLEKPAAPSWLPKKGHSNDEAKHMNRTVSGKATPRMPLAPRANRME
jgi:hypothetical protein